MRNKIYHNIETTPWLYSLEYPGAVYHITARGNARSCIFLEDKDKDKDKDGFLEILSDTRQRYNWLYHALCLIDNHYHLLIETIDPTLSSGMRQLNGVYTQSFNLNRYTM